MKMKKMKIVVDCKLIDVRKLRVCPICGGHEPVTKKAALYECVGHIGVKHQPHF